MPKTKDKPLTEKERLFILESYGEGTSIPNISLIFISKFRKKISHSAVTSVCHEEDNKAVIENYRSNYLVRIKDVSIANKRLRLNDLQNMRDRLFLIAEQLDDTTPEGRSELLLVFRRIHEIICVARDEMEGKSNAFTQINVTQLSNLSDEELQRRKEILLAKALGTYQEPALSLLTGENTGVTPLLKGTE